MQRRWSTGVLVVGLAVGLGCGGSGEECDDVTGSRLVVRPVDAAGDPVTVDAIEWLDGGGTFECAGADPNNCQAYIADWLPDMFMGTLQITHCGVITRVEVTSVAHDCMWQAEVPMQIGTCAESDPDRD